MIEDVAPHVVVEMVDLDEVHPVPRYGLMRSNPANGYKNAQCRSKGSHRSPPCDAKGDETPGFRAIV
jgi:hypothetical protein